MGNSLHIGVFTFWFLDNMTGCISCFINKREKKKQADEGMTMYNFYNLSDNKN